MGKRKSQREPEATPPESLRERAQRYLDEVDKALTDNIVTYSEAEPEPEESYVPDPMELDRPVVPGTELPKDAIAKAATLIVGKELAG